MYIMSCELGNMYCALTSTQVYALNNCKSAALCIMLSAGILRWMCRLSKMPRSYFCFALHNILKLLAEIIWPVVSLCSLIALKLGALSVRCVRGETPKCSEILVMKCLVVWPTYLAWQLEQRNSYTTRDLSMSGIASLNFNRCPSLKVGEKNHT